ncbi:MAG: hypothetical protein OEZ34_02250 [Spirochaetia bacterium]|nr:hypothetical protein [Spirochaetia bacterium]
MKKYLIIFLTLAFSFGAGFITIKFYSYIFAVKVDGRIERVERVTSPTAILGDIPSSQVFSFAVAVKNSEGEIFSASSEDRQWAIAEKGQCATVKFFPYPPWEFDKAGTFFNARLLKLKDCM